MSVVLAIVFACSLAVVAGNVLGVGISVLVRRHYGVELGWPVGELLLHATSVLAGALVLVFAASMIEPGDGHALLKPLRASSAMLGQAALAGMIIVAGNVIMAWISPERGLLAKLKETAVFGSLACILWLAPLQTVA